VVLALVLSGITISYNRAWVSEIALWERGVRIDPSSAIAFSHLGESYRRAERFQEARTAMERALAINPDMTVANIAMGALDLREGRYAEAEQYLRRVLSVYPDYAAALEQLGSAYMQQRKYDEAIELFREGARRMPYNSVRYEMNVAVLYRISGRPAEARRALESLRDALAVATDPAALKGFYYLGDLAREEGRVEDAKADYRSYLRATDSVRDNPEVEQLREIIRKFGVQ
jgi:serine/threonine-protein kinase